LSFAAFGGTFYRPIPLHSSAASRNCSHRRGGGDAGGGGGGGGGFWDRDDLFEMSIFQRQGPPPPLVPLILSVFLVEDEAGEPGVCEIMVAHPPDEESPATAANFYDTAVLRQA